MKINIGIDARFLLRPLRGMPTYVLNICQFLPALNREYSFFYFINEGFEHNDHPGNYRPRIERIINNNPNVFFVNVDDEGEIRWEQIYLPRLIKKYKIDIMHMPGNRICLMSNIPIIVTLHDTMEYIYCWRGFKKKISEDKTLRIFFYNLRIFLYALMIYKIGFRRAKKIITVSSYSANDIAEKLNINRDKITSIHHGVDESFFQSDLISHNERKFSLMLGGDSYQKNPELAIKAWANVDKEIRKKYPLKIIGFCGNDQSPLLKSIRKYKLTNEVQISGWISYDEIVTKFKYAKVFIFPSQYEGFGFPLIQAMASGTPVVSTNVTSIPELLENVGLKYKPDDPFGMAEGIEKILTNKHEWKHQSKLGQRRAGIFKWDKSVMHHLKLYEETLNRFKKQEQ